MPDPLDTPRQRHWGCFWTLGFAANLPLLFILGWEFTTNGGRAGMCLAVALLYSVGLGLCASGQGMREVMTAGAGWVAAGQLFPVLQLAAGIGAILAFHAIWHPIGDPVGSEVRGFAVTVLTGVPLGLTAFLLGGGLRLLRAAPDAEQAMDYG